jgi:hypothetical protein
VVEVGQHVRPSALQDSAELGQPVYPSIPMNPHDDGTQTRRPSGRALRADRPIPYTGQWMRDFLLNGPNRECPRSFDATPCFYRCRSEVLRGGR